MPFLPIRPLFGGGGVEDAVKAATEAIKKHGMWPG
jgi:hypothetical protein